MNLTYMGKPLSRALADTLRAELSTNYVPYVYDGQPYEPPETIITVEASERWPSEMKRGRPVILDTPQGRFDGKIKWRRMKKLVITGRFTSTS